jgi:lysozyme
MLKSEMIQNYIKKNEGLKLKPYKCTAGKTTIGYGRNIEDKGITKDEADFIFYTDFANCLNEYEKIFEGIKIDDTAEMVCLDMLFNLGLPTFRKFKNFIKCIKNKEYSEAADEIKYKSTTSPVLEYSPYWLKTKNRAKKNFELLKGIDTANGK